MRNRFETVAFGLWVTELVFFAPSGLMLLAGVIEGPTNFLYFPGDPPALDMAIDFLIISLPFAIVLRCMHLIFRARLAYSRFSKIVFRMVLFSSFFALACHSYRFSPAWTEVREGIKVHSDRILKYANNNLGPLSPKEFKMLQEKHFQQPIPVQLKGYGTVLLKMNSGVYPFITVDFGKGQNAAFDLKTMRCTYSD